MRTPISRVRSATMYDSTPYWPTVPRMTASSEITPSVSMVNASGSRASAARPAMVKVRYIGAPGATSRTSARISGAIVSARAVFTTYAGEGTRQSAGGCPTSG